MQLEEYILACGVATDFHGFMLVDGWFHHPTDPIKSVEVKGENITPLETSAGFCHEGVRDVFGEHCGFRVKAYSPSGRAIDKAVVIFHTASGKIMEVPALELANDGFALTGEDRLHREFRAMVANQPGASLLDVGGRDRSGQDFSLLFESAKCTVFDVNAGANVDVVGDAHRLSKFFPPNTFDFAQSISVFEHLAMPWVVVAELNRVLKVDGHAFISTHQSIGLHDYPWDFWRYSDRAFHALFNDATGFEIVETYMKTPNYIVPFLYGPRNWEHEKTAGFEVSCVIVRKTKPTRLSWTVDMSSIMKSAYPG